VPIEFYAWEANVESWPRAEEPSQLVGLIIRSRLVFCAQRRQIKRHKLLRTLRYTGTLERTSPPWSTMPARSGRRSPLPMSKTTRGQEIGMTLGQKSTAAARMTCLEPAKFTTERSEQCGRR